MKSIKELRESRGFSQQDLASKAGIGVATISRIEQGKNKPNNATLSVIAAALNVKPAFLKIV